METKPLHFIVMGRIWVLEDGQDMGVGGWAGYGCWRMGRIWVLEDGQDMGVGCP